MKRKKILIISVSVFALLVGLLVAAPFMFKGKIKAAVLKAVNENLNASVDFEDVSISLFKNFPQASLTLENLKVVNVAPFENDTLTYIKELNLDMSIKELFKGENEAMKINGIKLDGAYLNFVSNKDGIANFDIMKPSTSENEESSGFNLAVNYYEIKNSHIKYVDEASGMSLELKDFNHSGSGDLTAEESKLKTLSSAKLSFEFDKIKYFDENELTLDALIGINLKTNTYTFLENNAVVSGLPLVFDGFISLLENGQDMAINFKTPTSSFKNFLAVMPKAYAKNLDIVQTSGDFTVIGEVKGQNNDDRIPNFKINIASDNASFKYPDLPKGVDHITIKAEINNESGIIDDTYVMIDAFNFRIDQDEFMSNASIIDLTGNPLVNATLKGTINLGNLSKAYPIQLEQQLSGILKMDIAANFDMEAVEQSKYERIRSIGSLSLTDFVYNGEEFLNPLKIKSTSVNFTPQVIVLKEFLATTGKTDISATGTLDDVIGFVLSDKKLKGNFNLQSKVFSVNDFMSETAPTETAKKAESASIKIPSFLDCSITAQAATVYYDNLELKNLKGKMSIKDEKVTLENVSSSIFGGNIGLNGSVSTKEVTPIFDMEVGMNSFNIAESFSKMDMLKALAPIASIIEGKLNSTVKLSGKLSNDFAPNLATISGNALAEIQTKAIDTKTSPLLNTLASQLKFIDVSKLNLNDIKALVSFENGKVNVKPFTIKYKDIDINVTGSHGFDKSMSYRATFNVPAKYLGNEVTGLMSKISSEDASKIMVPITAVIGGNFDKPTVTTDYKSAVTSLTTQLVDVNKLKAKGVNAISDLIKGSSIIKKNTDTTKVSTKTTTPDKIDVAKPKEAVENLVKNKLNNLLIKKKKDTAK